MNLPNRDELVKATEDAATVILDDFRKPSIASIKSDDTPVTKTDLAVHNYLRDWSKKYPELGYIGEEGNDFHEDCKYAIYVDPLDGTSGYMRGMACATTVLTLMERHSQDVWTPHTGVIHDPITGWTWSAECCKNTLYTRHRIKNRLELPKQELSVLGIPYQVTVCVWPNVPHNLDKVLRSVHSSREYNDQAFGSIALGAGLIASGGMHATLFAGRSAVETTAMSLIVRGAGGIATDLYGNELGKYQLVEQNGKLDFELPLGAIMSSHQEVTDGLVKIVKAAQ